MLLSELLPNSFLSLSPLLFVGIEGETEQPDSPEHLTTQSYTKNATDIWRLNVAACFWAKESMCQPKS